MSESRYLLLMVAVTAGVTIVLRALPFIMLNGAMKSHFIDYLGRMLAPASIAMLVIYCLSGHLGTSPSLTAFGAEAAGVITVLVLHLWKHNPLLSILGGTIIYMLILQNI